MRGRLHENPNFPGIERSYDHSLRVILCSVNNYGAGMPVPPFARLIFHFFMFLYSNCIS